MRSNSALIVLFVAPSRGPPSETDADATTSEAGAPVKVSAILKKSAPDCESLLITVELVSWISGEVVVDESCAPCWTANAEQHVAGDVANAVPKPSDVVLKVLLVAERSGPASVSRLGVPEAERRSERMSADASTLLSVKVRSGCVLVLLTWLPSK